MDPKLIDEQVPVGVELVVANSVRKDYQIARVIQRYPRGLVGGFAIDSGPVSRSRSGITGLYGLCVLDLGVDPLVAELRVVDLTSTPVEYLMPGRSRNV